MAMVLIVDDHADICRVLARFVRLAGHRAEYRTGGQEAIEFLRGDVPDFVILDVMMPVVDGFDVLRFIRHDPRLSRVPVVMFSAAGEAEFVERALSQGANDYWVKGSIDLSQIDTRLTQYIGAA